ncbi:CLUMA_CG017928, isoform A [Clunio marinus]|uniref:CLUMA_CG017928, isoform A n=1 Tax=Clunio marinus TaxID=568069 RepID=A0A1J1IZA3_9DIPT|nr:CLUMA_CG017928, isoform A [Clunio marinus]
MIAVILPQISIKPFETSRRFRRCLKSFFLSLKLFKFNVTLEMKLHHEVFCLLVMEKKIVRDNSVLI